MADSYIKVEDLIKTYSSKAEVLVVLNGIDFEVDRGEIICFLGTSGSGKTTTLNLLAGIDKPSAGKILYDKNEIHSWSLNQLAEYRLNEIGFIFQDFYLMEHLTALENIMIPLILRGETEDMAKEYSVDLLHSVGLGRKALSLPQELSSGEKQRVCVARAIANSPSLLIADEPTGTLDTKTGDGIMELLLNLVKKNNMSLIYTSHDPYLTRLADKIIVLQKGKVSQYSQKEFPEVGYDKASFQFLVGDENHE
ncbi:MAG: ABC transporter ATP-binding protein [Candidatus Heimdallarchaeota archaeon]|nr:ABC transporter ATP-binding protein [Candidatus Heimdallarchaeota archaeon]